MMRVRCRTTTNLSASISVVSAIGRFSIAPPERVAPFVLMLIPLQAARPPSLISAVCRPGHYGDASELCGQLAAIVALLFPHLVPVRKRLSLEAFAITSPTTLTISALVTP